MCFNLNYTALTLSQTTNSSLFKTESVSDNYLKFDENGRNFSKKGRKQYGVNEKLLLFPTVFSKDLYCRHIKTRACLGKG